MHAQMLLQADIQHLAETKCIQACRRGHDIWLKFKPSVRTVKKGDLSDFDCGVVVTLRQASLMYWNFPTKPFLFLTENDLEKVEISSEQQF